MRSLVLVAAAVLACDPNPSDSPRPAPPPQPEAEPDVAAEPVAAPVGLTYQRTRITNTDVEADVFVAQLEHIRLVALDARAGGRSTARADVLRRESGAFVAVNGTFFTASEQPLGLLQQGSTTLSRLRDADWGVLEVDTGGRARLVHTRDYTPSPEVEFAVQCGPRVVIGGQVPRLKPQSASRTALCVRSAREIAVVVTRGLVQADAIGHWLAAPPPDGGLGCTDALLLDGGPSTQVSAEFGNTAVELMGGWGVPNGVGLVPREGIVVSE
jgi:uncharacterized protein YigE (DUF2233 family)